MCGVPKTERKIAKSKGEEEMARDSERFHFLFFFFFVFVFVFVFVVIVF
jgi:cell division septal protein FtsQ